MQLTLEGLIRQHRRRSPKRAARPFLEGLEDRMLMYAANGGAWTYGSRITYSFVPDGTSIGGVSSNLFSTLNAAAPTATWEAAFQQAAAIWSSYANVNIAQVSDSGVALGILGNQQGDSRFGDIRIGMIPQNGGVLAYATLPPPINGGTNAGDIVFNSNIAWKINADYDVETVALHEMGHALGLDHSSLTNAVLYTYYTTQKHSLTADDVSGIQSIYGAYPSDHDTNRSFSTATNLTGLIDGNSQIAVPGLNLAGTTDYDFFTVTVPSTTTGSMTVTMQSANLSSVSPRLIIYNSAYSLVSQNSMPNVFGATDSIVINGVTPGQIYYIKCSAASTLGSFGAFGLLVNFGSHSQAPIAPPNTVVAFHSDQGGGSLNLAGDPPYHAGGFFDSSINPVEDSYARPTDLSALALFYQSYNNNGHTGGQTGNATNPPGVPPNSDALTIAPPLLASSHASPKKVHHRGGPTSALPLKSATVVVNLHSASHGHRASTHAHDAALAAWAGAGQSPSHVTLSSRRHHG